MILQVHQVGFRVIKRPLGTSRTLRRHLPRPGRGALAAVFSSLGIRVFLLSSFHFYLIFPLPFMHTAFMLPGMLTLIDDREPHAGLILDHLPKAGQAVVEPY